MNIESLSLSIPSQIYVKYLEIPIFFAYICNGEDIGPQARKESG